MSGERDLAVLLRSIQPELLEQDYVFVTFPDGSYGDGAHLLPIGAFQEKEGLTLIIPRQLAANNNIKVDTILKCISLKVHSSLEAVGLTAAISKVLANKNISANVVAGFFHDHVFVPADDAQKAMSALSQFGD
jgi:hypothetical protein